MTTAIRGAPTNSHMLLKYLASPLLLLHIFNLHPSNMLSDRTRRLHQLAFVRQYYPATVDPSTFDSPPDEDEANTALDQHEEQYPVDEDDLLDEPEDDFDEDPEDNDGLGVSVEAMAYAPLETILDGTRCTLVIPSHHLFY